MLKPFLQKGAHHGIGPRNPTVQVPSREHEHRGLLVEPNRGDEVASVRLGIRRSPSGHQDLIGVQVDPHKARRMLDDGAQGCVRTWSTPVRSAW